MPKPTLLYQPLGGYCYNSDTIFLHDFIIKHNIKKNSNILEVGSGCGVLGVLLARDIDIKLTQIEIQDIFYNLSCTNKDINNIQSNVIKKDFLQFETKEKFDYIVSNPPFYSTGVLESKNNQINICKINSSLPIKEFFAKVSKLLNPRAQFIFCYSPYLIQEITHYLHISNLRIEKMKFVYPKKDKLASLVLISCRKNSKSDTKIEPSLVVFDKDDFYDNVKEVYKNANTYTIKCQF